MAITSRPGWIALQYLADSSIASAIPAAVLYLRFMFGIASKSEQSGICGTSANNSLIAHLRKSEYYLHEF